MSRKTQAERGAEFAALHAAPGAFVIPNPWDPGTARMLAGLGFRALATTSAGLARSRGRTDYLAGRADVMAHIADLCDAIDLPVSADLENGFGLAPETCAETIRLGAAAGLVGGSIEDTTGDAADPIIGFEAAVERVRAAAEAARSLPFRFTLTARAENFLHGRKDLADTIARLQAFQEAGADVLYAPGLPNAAAIRTVCSSVDRPVNVLAGLDAERLDLAGLAALGVKRASTGSWLHSAAMGAFLRAAREMAASGGFGFLADVAAGRDMDALLATGAPDAGG